MVRSGLKLVTKFSAMQSRVLDELEKFGVTGPSRDWIIKSLDPASVGPAPGIPDASDAIVLRPEYRTQVSLTAPVDTSSGSVPASWDLMCIIPPGDMNAMYWVSAPAGADFSTIVTLPTSWNTGTVQLAPFSDLAGPLNVRFLNPAPTPVNDLLVSTRAPTSLPYTHRHMYKSVTATFSGSDLINQGDVFAAQFPTEPRTIKPVGFGNNVTSAGYPIIAQIFCVAIPFNEKDLMLCAPGAMEGKAKDGCYMPLHFTGPTISFADVAYFGSSGNMFNPTTGSNQPFLLANGTPVQIPRFFQPVQNDDFTSADRTAFQSAATDPTDGSTPCPDTGYDNTNTGVMIWRGLAGGNVSPASIVFKILVGLEVRPRPTSVDRVFAKLALPYEPRAIEAYLAISGQLDDAYPASYNSLGAILSVIGEAAKRIIPVVQAGLGGVMQYMNQEDKAPEASRPMPVVVRASAPLASYTKGSAGVLKKWKKRIAKPSMSRSRSKTRPKSKVTIVASRKRRTKRGGGS